jgi:hypothetical protein
VSTTGLSRDGFILKGGIGRITARKLVDKLVRLHTNLVLRESLDDALRDLLPLDIELVIDESVDEKEEEPEA